MSRTHPDAFTALLAALRRHIARGAARPDAVGSEIARVLELLARLPARPAVPQPSGHPVTRHLPAALALARATAPDLAAALAPVAAALPWRYSYVPRDDAPGLEQEMAWAEIAGPGAPFDSEEVCLGLTLIGPGSYYPPHRHPAVELYDVVAGTAEWTAAAGPLDRPPGSFILHPSNAPHAMRTRREPLLAIYSWTGDVRTLSSYIPDPAGSTDTET